MNFPQAFDDSNAYFTVEEVSHITKILRSAYDIRTCKGEDDFLLKEFIDALDNVAEIHIEDDDVEPQEIEATDTIY